MWSRLNLHHNICSNVKAKKEMDNSLETIADVDDANVKAEVESIAQKALAERRKLKLLAQISKVRFFELHFVNSPLG